MQITIAYGFSPWRGQIYEMLESKDLWNDLFNDLVIPTMPTSPPNRLVFSRFLGVFRGFSSFFENFEVFGIALLDSRIDKDLK